jgi:hypothetical protein
MTRPLRQSQRHYCKGSLGLPIDITGTNRSPALAPGGKHRADDNS